jgi:flagellar biosynthesis chaperone FliJ
MKQPTGLLSMSIANALLKLSHINESLPEQEFRLAKDTITLLDKLGDEVDSIEKSYGKIRRQLDKLGVDDNRKTSQTQIDTLDGTIKDQLRNTQTAMSDLANTLDDYYTN